MRITRNPLPAKVKIPVLYIPAALEIFERTIGQEPEYEEEIVDGYIEAEVYQNDVHFWERLLNLARQGIVWLPEQTMEDLARIWK